MGILDEAIREHLELKRQHGADDSELKQLEDEAFGPAERPEAAAAQAEHASEAPTEFMAQPEPGGEQGEATSAEAVREAPIRREPSPEIASLQEAPELQAPEPEPEQEPERTPEGGTPTEPEPAEEPQPEPAEEPQPALEHEAISEPAAPSGPTTEEREAIAEHPTEHYDVEEELDREQAPPADQAAPPAEEPAEEDEFFDEKRLSDELDQALESPQREEEVDHGEHGEEEEEEHYDDEPEEHDEEAPGRSEEDLLDETPDFLAGSEDDELWFEQKPPKDFDFDD
jgi:hypothetical protein